MLYRLDRKGEPEANGSIPVYTNWIGGPTIAAIHNCPVNGTNVRRSARVTGEPDSFFSQPAYISFAGRRVKGYITGADNGGFEFRAVGSQLFPTVHAEAWQLGPMV